MDEAQTTSSPVEPEINSETAASSQMLNDVACRRPRLVIQSLRLENFKSYGGVVQVGPFHKRFSSIVGPNGSGKSNVIDAMLFVFGRRAKQLRHSKLRELLHHSDTYPDVASATVTVYFQEIIDTGDADDDYEVVEGSEFSVARRAFRNDVSKYYLNDQEVKMSMVVDLLKSKGVDLDNNRFLILQGEVEQIAMMKPKATSQHEDGLLEYLEDIIGSNKYIEAIAESLKAVEQLNEERSHKLNRVKAAERERDSLEDAKTEAEDYMDKERDMFTKRLKLTRWRHLELSQKVVGKKAAEDKALAELEEARKRLQEDETMAQELQTQFEIKKKFADAVASELNGAREEYATCERSDIQLGTDLKALKSKEKKLRNMIEREVQRSEKCEEDVSTHDHERQIAEDSIKNLEKDLSEATSALEAVRERVRTKTEPLRIELEKRQTELLPLKSVVNDCQREVDVAKSELSVYRESFDAPKRSLEEAHASLTSLQNTLEEARMQKSTETEKQRALENQLARNAEENSCLRSKAKALSGEIHGTRRKVEEARQASEQSISQSKLLSSLYDASRSGQLKGIVGRLGDLGSVQDKYSTAVSAAAGATLDNVVVWTAEDAQLCIEYMRQNNLGRSTFIILDKLRYLESRMNARNNDGTRLFDLIEVDDERNRLAFYFALRDTLVARTLEEARRLAFKPTKLNRVVTLEGELIESSGAMTGGGREPPRFKLGSKSCNSPSSNAQYTPEEIERLARHVDGLTAEKEACEARADALSSETRKLKVEMETRSTELAKISNNVASLTNRITELNSKILPDLKRAVASADKSLGDKKSAAFIKIQSLSDTVSKKEVALSNAKEACIDLEKAVERLQQKIVEAGGGEMKSAKEAVDRTNVSLSEQRSAVASARSRASAAQQAAGSARKAVQDAKVALEQIDLGRQALNSKRTDLEQKAQSILESFTELEKRHDDASEGVRNIAKDHAVVKQKVKEGRQAELPLIDKVNEVCRLHTICKNELSELQNTIQSVQKKLKRLVQSASDMELPGVCEENECVEQREEHNGEEETREEGAVEDAMSERPDDAEITPVSPEECLSLEREIAVVEAELAKNKPNLTAIAEYRRKDVEYKVQVKELDELTQSRDAARRENDSLRKARLDEFMRGFSIITLKLKELYQMITLGGDAELELVDSLDPFSEGIVFSVRPPKKSWKNISNLSGGEKTLSSLALVFALHHFKPTPLYFLDEIDAALDFKNVSIVANYVKERTKDAQFIIISLRNNMFELADRLVGIYKTQNTTKSVTVNPKAFVIPHEAVH